MAFFEDEEERRNRAMGQAPAAPVMAASGGPSVGPGAPVPQAGNFVNWDTLLGLNADAGARMAGELAGGVEDQGNAARAGLQDLQTQQSAAQGTAGAPANLAAMPGYDAVQKQANETAAQAKLLAPGGTGLATLATQQYGKGGGYTQGMGAFDAMMAGGAGGDQLQKTANTWGDFGKAIGLANETSAKPPPGAPPPAGGGDAPPEKHYDPMSNQYTYGINKNKRKAKSDPRFAGLGSHEGLDPKGGVL